MEMVCTLLMPISVIIFLKVDESFNCLSLQNKISFMALQVKISFLFVLKVGRRATS